MGSTSLTTDSSGAVVSEVRYLPYGEERWGNGEAVTDFGFTSQRNERGFGLYDYNARYYSPTLGRFISPDTIVPEPASSGGFNRYRYTRNNPLRYTDPSGHCVAICIGIGIALTVAVIFFYNEMPVGEGAPPHTPVKNYVESGTDIVGDAAVLYNEYPDNVPLNLAAMAIPGASAAMLKGAKGLVKGGLSVVEEAAAIKTIAKGSIHGELTEGSVVSLGHFYPKDGAPGYIDWAKDNGATYFDMAPDVYATIKEKKGLSWAINEQFLDDAIEAGADFRLQSPTPSSWDSGFGREIKYLEEKGYKMVEEDGDWWMKR